MIACPTCQAEAILIQEITDQGWTFFCTRCAETWTVKTA